MAEIQEYKCKTCDSLLDMSVSANGVVECKFCHNVYTVPKPDTRKDIRELLSIAEHELDTCSFDRAYTAYEKVISLEPSEPEARFGMAIAEFKVQYLKDAKREHLQPICHDITDKKFTRNKHYLRTLELASREQREVYEQRAKEIEEICGEFNRLEKCSVRYDSFICVKVTDRDTSGKIVYTQDSHEALRLYNHLKKRGYNPFYSEEEIKGKAGAVYEAHILYALFTAECMLVVCGNEDYLQTPWVKNEYVRFMELVNDERKDTDSVTIVFSGRPIERLPGKRTSIQGVNLGSPDAYNVIEEFVNRHTPRARAVREETLKQNKKREEEILKRIAEQKAAQRELEEQLKGIREQSAASVQTLATGVTVNSMLIRARQFVDDKSFDKAAEYIDRVLDIDPKNYEAWWTMFLIKNKAVNGDEILRDLNGVGVRAIQSDSNYNNAKKYANKKLPELNEFTEKFEEITRLVLEKEAADLETVIENENREQTKLIVEKTRLKNELYDLRKTNTLLELSREDNRKSIAGNIILYILFVGLFILAIISAVGDLTSHYDNYFQYIFFTICYFIGSANCLFFSMLFALKLYGEMNMYCNRVLYIILVLFVDLAAIIMMVSAVNDAKKAIRNVQKISEKEKRLFAIEQALSEFKVSHDKHEEEMKELKARL